MNVSSVEVPDQCVTIVHMVSADVAAIPGDRIRRFSTGRQIPFCGFVGRSIRAVGFGFVSPIMQNALRQAVVSEPAGKGFEFVERRDSSTLLFRISLEVLF
jgi:hypothetical protein